MEDDERTRPFPRDGKDESARSMLRDLCHLLEGLAVHHSANEAISAAQRIPLDNPAVLDDVDMEIWAVWALTGLRLFSGDPPTLRVVTLESRRVLLLAALGRHGGNITRMARAVGTSRRVLREHLKAAGLYSRGGIQADSLPPVKPDLRPRRGKKA